MVLTYIYSLHAPDGELRYIGKTSQTPARRLSVHLAVARHRSPRHKSHCISWIRTLLNNGQEPTMRVIEVVEGDGWPEIERFWIAYHRSRGYRLVNISDGGETNLGSPRTPEWKAAIGLANRGVKNAQAKLNEASVQQIKVLLLQKNLNNQEIAEQFGVSRRTISFINTGARWAHVKLPEDDSDNLWFL